MPPIDVGTPGASAQQEFERRHAKHEQRIEQKWGTGRLGRMAKFLSDDPQSTTAWAQGARGEERVAAILSERLAEDAVLLHDRKVPTTRGNIDHIAIAPSGVWVIDAKKYTGKVEKRDVGGFFTTDLRLYVGGRDRSKAVDGLQWQVDAVRTVTEDEAIPIHPALSFVGAEWPLFFAKPFQLKGVWISWPRKLAELVLGDGPLTIDDVDRIADCSRNAFPRTETPASPRTIRGRGERRRRDPALPRHSVCVPTRSSRATERADDLGETQEEYLFVESLAAEQQRPIAWWVSRVDPR